MGFVLGTCFVVWFLELSNHLTEEKRAGCIAAVCIMPLFLTVPSVGLQSVIVAFPGQWSYSLTIIKASEFAC